MKFFFTAFGSHNKYIVTDKPDHGVAPLSKETSGGLDLDYTALMIGTNFAIDKNAFEYVISGEKEFLRPMANTLLFLKNEELITLVDFGEIVNQNEDRLDAMLNRMLENPIEWFRIVQNQWSGLKNYAAEFHEKYGDSNNRIRNTEHFGVVNYLASIDELSNSNLLEKLNSLLEKRKTRYTNEEIDHIREICKPLLAQILINELIRKKYKQPFLDWDDAKEFYEKLYELSWDDNTDEITLYQQANYLFDVIIPDLKPSNIEEVVRFIRDSGNVASMRNDLLKLIGQGEPVSKEFFIKYSNLVFQKKLATDSKMKKFRLAGSFLTSFIPGMTLAQELAMTVGEEVIGDAFDSRGNVNMEWYYALQKEAVRRNN